MRIFQRAKPTHSPAPARPSQPRTAEGAPEGITVDLRGDAQLEALARAKAASLLETARANQGGVLSAAFWSDKLMAWSMRDEAFKVQLFRFVDAFPTLKSSDAVYEHLTDYLSQPGVTLPPGMETMLKAGGLARGLVAKTMSSQIQSMAAKFIAGRDAKDALPQLAALWNDGYAFSVDLLGEACVSDAEAEAYRAKYLDLIENLPSAVASWPERPVLERDHLGAVPRVNVSIKISSLYARTDPIDTEGSVRGLVGALEPVLRAAAARGVFVNFDMEQHSLKDLTLELFMRCCERVDFHAGLAMQAYLRSGEADARRITEWSRASGRQVTVRLVKGAYWDYETIHAEQQGWPVPVWGAKRETDACFERMAGLLIDSCPRRAGDGGVKLALGSHNARSIGAALAMVERAGLPPSAIEFQMLHGMGDALKAAAREQGLRVREYVPVGEMIPGMAYLVRRLLENTSNESWLKAGFADGADAALLVASPHRSTDGASADDPASRHAASARRHALSASADDIGDGLPFFTEPMRDFSVAAVRTRFASAVCNFPSKLRI